MLILESARVKQYTGEYALSAMLVLVAAGVRRDGATARWTIAGGVTVVVSVMFSFALMIPAFVVAIVFIVALSRESHLKGRRLCTGVAGRVAVLASTGLVVALWAHAFLQKPTGALKAHWQGDFLGSSRSVSRTGRQAVAMLRGFWAALLPYGGTPLLVVPVALLLWFTLSRFRSEWWLILAPLEAVGLSVAHRYPLGSILTNRVDAWLLPWVGVMIALALTDLTSVRFVRRRAQTVPGAVAYLALGLAGALVFAASARNAKGYPPTRADLAVTALTRAARAGRPAFVADVDWPVDLKLPNPVRIVTDRNSETDFSVVPGRHISVLHVRDEPRAIQELHATCQHTVTIVGVASNSLQRIFARLGCPILAWRVATSNTTLHFDDIVTVTLGPQPPVS